jgi:glucokinase
MTKPPTEAKFIGIEIGGTKLQIVTGDAAAKILERQRFAVDRAQGAGGIRRQIAGAMAEICAATKPAAVGVGYGGPVDWRTGRICCSHHIEGWSDFELGQWLEKLTGAPVFVDNDANVAALGEAFHGAGVGADPVFYVTLGSGVGGGVIAGGRIYHGATPGEVEIGHVRLDRAGTILESRCSGWSVDARIRALADNEPAGMLVRLSKEKPGNEARHLAEALQSEDGAAQRILREVSEDLAFGLSHVTQLFHPEVIILGGGLSNLGEPLRGAVEQALRPWVMKAFAPGPRVCLAKLAEDVVPVGALELARQNIERRSGKRSGRDRSE